MRRRTFLGLGLACVLMLSGSRAALGERARLNVLFLLADDLRPELACYGAQGAQSPNIDALARAGVRFERAYCQFPLCNPSRTSMLTGRYPTTSGVLDNLKHFRDEHPDWVTLPQHFKANGYTTIRVGKIFHGGLDDAEAWTIGAEAPAAERTGASKARRSNRPKSKEQVAQRRRNSDRIVVLEGEGEAHGDYRTTERAIAQLRAHHDKPFFLACGFTKPHSPPTAPKRFFDLHDPAKIVLPPDFAARVTVPPGFPAACLTPNGDLFIERDASAEEARRVLAAYRASASWTDHNVGLVLAELDRLGLRGSTIVVFWGDHGYHLGEKGKWAKHGSLFETGARVPLIIDAPGARGNGTACPRVVQTLDLYPTLVDLCGLAAPSGLEGHSLKALLDDPHAAWDHPAFTVSNNQGRAVRTDRWRYAEWDQGRNGAMLIDERNDPHELKNLVDDPRYDAVRKELSAALKPLH